MTYFEKKKILFSEGPFLILGHNNQFPGTRLIFRKMSYKIVVDILVTPKKNYKHSNFFKNCKIVRAYYPFEPCLRHCFQNKVLSDSDASGSVVNVQYDPRSTYMKKWPTLVREFSRKYALWA
jgi:hypothetical protein